MSECCKELFAVLDKYGVEDPKFEKSDFLVVISFILSWNQRQCRCVFHDQVGLARLEDQLQLLLGCAVENVIRWTDSRDDSEDESSSDTWSVSEKEKLLCAVVKVFQLHFPFYQARKIHLLNKNVSSKDCAKYCDMNDIEVPEALLINVAWFCDKGGLTAIRNVFRDADTVILPFHVAHLLINIVTQLRVLFSVQAIMHYIIPLRRPVIRYLCKLTDEELRQPDGRVMADTMWSAVKGPMESGPVFDRDSMDLAFKYFTSSTLTVRLAGLNQITNQVHVFMDLFQADTISGVDSMCMELSQWLVENKLVEHIFGPNLHVELLKQAQIILNYLAQEAYLTTQHLDCIWVAAQLKHASRYVHDLLTVLTKHMDMQSILYLLDLVARLPAASHTKQSLYLASVLIRIVWRAGLSPNAAQTGGVARSSPVQGPVVPAAAAALARKCSRTGSLSQSSSHSGSLSDMSAFDGDQRELDESPTPGKFDASVPTQASIRISTGALKRRLNNQDASAPYSAAAEAFSSEDKSREDVEVDSTSCTNSHGSSLSERQELEEFEGEDVEDEMKGVAALRGVQSDDAEGPKNMGFDLNSVCEEGKTLLWDLIQDHNAVGSWWSCCDA